MVSVIIPNYNHAPYLEQRISSVLNQTYKNIEVIVLDDNSTDNSKQIIDHYRADTQIKHIIYNQTNSGSPFIQWKKGIDLAKGKYIWIAESDDYSDLTFLEKVMAKIENDPETVICYSNSYIIENEKANEVNKSSFGHNKLFRTNRWSGDFQNDGVQELIHYMGGFCTIINASSCVFLKSAFPHQNNDLYKFKYCGDWLVWIEMSVKGKIIFITEPLNYFRVHPKPNMNEFSKKQKAKKLAKEYYECLIKARQLTNGKSIIPNETFETLLYIWANNSIYFFLRNFTPELFMMHAGLDKDFPNKILRAIKNYLRIKFAKRKYL
jgi:glycosyltransferase involved in cell wall biosynthesis